jgi:hypothetical protein
MRGLKHSGEYALILSENELVLFKALFAANNETLMHAVNEAHELSRIKASQRYFADRLLKAGADSDILEITLRLLREKEESIYIES